MTDAEILEEITAAYEMAAWYADLGAVDHDLVDTLAAVVRAMRDRDVGGITGWPSWPLAVIGWRDAA
jgi:hypothetical protein